MHTTDPARGAMDGAVRGAGARGREKAACCAVGSLFTRATPPFLPQTAPAAHSRRQRASSCTCPCVSWCAGSAARRRGLAGWGGAARQAPARAGRRLGVPPRRAGLGGRRGRSGARREILLVKRRHGAPLGAARAQARGAARESSATVQPCFMLLHDDLRTVQWRPNRNHSRPSLPPARRPHPLYSHSKASACPAEADGRPAGAQPAGENACAKWPSHERMSSCTSRAS